MVVGEGASKDTKKPLAAVPALCVVLVFTHLLPEICVLPPFVWCVAVGYWRCVYVTVLGPSPAEGVCVWSGGVARWDDIPIRAVYNASQDDGYLELVVVPMMLRAGCGVRVCVACVRG